MLPVLDWLVSLSLTLALAAAASVAATAGMVFSTEVLPLAGTAAVVRINMPGTRPAGDAVAAASCCCHGALANSEIQRRAVENLQALRLVQCSVGAPTPADVCNDA